MGHLHNTGHLHNMGHLHDTSHLHSMGHLRNIGRLRNTGHLHNTGHLWSINQPGLYSKDDSLIACIIGSTAVVCSPDLQSVYLADLLA